MVDATGTRGSLSSPHGQSASQTLFAVIIPALNEAKVIATCLRALERQTLPGDCFEVLLVDNGSKDGTPEIAASFAGTLNLRVLRTNARSIAAVRNVGAAATTARYLAFLDADCVPHPGWLEKAGALFHSDSKRIIGAHYQIADRSSWLARAWFGDRSELKAGPIAYVPAGDLIVSRDVFSKLTGFDPNIATSEDCDLCQRAAAAGFGVFGFPELGVLHLGTPQTLSAFYRQQRWHGNHVHKVFWKDVRRSPARKAVFYALYTIGALVCAALLGIAGLITRNSFTILLAIALIAFAPSIMSARAAWKRKDAGIFFPLVFLYLVYGLARAMPFLGFQSKGRAGSK